MSDRSDSLQENFWGQEQEDFGQASLSSNSFVQTKTQNLGSLPKLLNKQDVKLLNALALMQLNYGQAHEAVALLLLCRLNEPENLQTLRLLIRAYIANEWWDKADEAIKEFKFHSSNANPLVQLFDALNLLGQLRIEEARTQFKVFCNSKLRIAS